MLRREICKNADLILEIPQKISVETQGFYVSQKIYNFKYNFKRTRNIYSPFIQKKTVTFQVNETRHRWSNDFKCGKKEKDLESVIALTCFFCFLPIVFYVGAKLHADVRERKSGKYLIIGTELTQTLKLKYWKLLSSGF